MGISVYPPPGTEGAAPNLSYTVSQVLPSGPTALSAVGNEVAVVTMFQRSFSGAMFSVSGTYTGLVLAFEAGNYGDQAGTYQPWPAWHMRQGVQMTSDYLVNNSAQAYWMPSNGAVTLRMRVAAIASGAATGAAIAMHAPATLGTGGPPSKLDWQAFVIEGTPGNNVMLMQNMGTTTQTGIATVRGSQLNVASHTIPVGKRLRIHSWEGSFLAGVAGGKCRVDLKSNLTGATTTASDTLGTWLFGPTGGGTNPDERWSGLSGTFPEPVDIYNNGSGASMGIAAGGSAGTNGKLSFTLFGYQVG